MWIMHSVRDRVEVRLARDVAGEEVGGTERDLGAVLPWYRHWPTWPCMGKAGTGGVASNKLVDHLRLIHQRRRTHCDRTHYLGNPSTSVFCS